MYQSLGGSSSQGVPSRFSTTVESLRYKTAGWDLKKIGLLALHLFIPVLGGFLSGLANSGATDSPSSWYYKLKRPSFSPPGWVFAPVWTLLYLSMGYASYRICVVDGQYVWRTRIVPLALYAVHLVFNVFWSPIFFGMRRLDLGFGEIVALWALIASMMYMYKDLDKVAVGCLAPYIAWVSFASILNLAYWVLNPHLGIPVSFTLFLAALFFANFSVINFSLRQQPQPVMQPGMPMPILPPLPPEQVSWKARALWMQNDVVKPAWAPPLWTVALGYGVSHWLTAFTFATAVLRSGSEAADVFEAFAFFLLLGSVLLSLYLGHKSLESLVVDRNVPMAVKRTWAQAAVLGLYFFLIGFVDAGGMVLIIPAIAWFAFMAHLLKHCSIRTAALGGGQAELGMGGYHGGQGVGGYNISWGNLTTQQSATTAAYPPVFSAMQPAPQAPPATTLQRVSAAGYAPPVPIVQQEAQVQGESAGQAQQGSGRPAAAPTM